MSPIISYTRIREFAERWSWTDRHTGLPMTGYDPPSDAIDPQHVPFTITFLTEEGIPYRAQVVCVGVNTATHTRNLRFVSEGRVYLPKGNPKNLSQFKVIPSGDFRQVSDLLISEIDGVRFFANN